MPLNLGGGAEPTAIYIGSTTVNEVWVGGVKVWPSAPPPPPAPCALQDPGYSTNKADLAWLTTHASEFAACTDFDNAWYNCGVAGVFPLIDTQNATSLRSAWYGCSSLTTFPLIVTSAVTNMESAWQGCSSLTTFPLLDLASITNVNGAWRDCTLLTPQSRENIFVSLNNSGKTGLATTVGGTGGTPAAKAAYDSLIAKGWTFSDTTPPP